mgnify:FL=1
MMINTNKDLKPSLFSSLTLNWVLLLLLTLIAVMLSQLNMASNILIMLALAITVIKSQIVVDRFMGLKDIEFRWRALMLAYIVIIPAIIVIIYLTATNI